MIWCNLINNETLKNERIPIRDFKALPTHRYEKLKNRDDKEARYGYLSERLFDV